LPLNTPESSTKDTIVEAIDDIDLISHNPEIFDSPEQQENAGHMNKYEALKSFRNICSGTNIVVRITRKFQLYYFIYIFFSFC